MIRKLKSELPLAILCLCFFLCFAAIGSFLVQKEMISKASDERRAVANGVITKTAQSQTTEGNFGN